METSSLILAECQQTNEDRRRVKMRIKRRNSSLKAEIQDICVFKISLLALCTKPTFPFTTIAREWFYVKESESKMLFAARSFYWPLIPISGPKSQLVRNCK